MVMCITANTFRTPEPRGYRSRSAAGPCPPRHRPPALRPQPGPRLLRQPSARLRPALDGGIPRAGIRQQGALRDPGVLRAAWRLGLVPTDAYQRAVDVPAVRGSRLSAGRSLDAGELAALFRACADGTPGGARHAAAFGLMFGCGLRRSETVAVRLEDLDPETGAIRVIGKDNRERTVYAPQGAQAAIDAWLDVRGRDDGPLRSASGNRQGRHRAARACSLRLKIVPVYGIGMVRRWSTGAGTTRPSA